MVEDKEVYVWLKCLDETVVIANGLDRYHKCVKLQSPLPKRMCKYEWKNIHTISQSSPISLIHILNTLHHFHTQARF